jgi:lipoprotein signal peptidase
VYTEIRVVAFYDQKIVDAYAVINFPDCSIQVMSIVLSILAKKANSPSKIYSTVFRRHSIHHKKKHETKLVFVP